MPPILVVIRNICVKGQAPQEIIEDINRIDGILKETLEEITN